jgi:hypothetical protein
MVSDRVDFEGLDQRIYPEELTAAMDSARAAVDARPARDLARFTRLGDEFDPWRRERWGQMRRALRILDDVIRHDLVTLETARVALRHGQPDLTALYFRGNDNTQHLFWKYRLAQRQPRVAARIYDEPAAEDVELLATVIDRYYDFADDLIGEVLEMLEPDTAVLVLSDHGFLTNNERSQWYNPNRLLAAGGLTVLEPEGGGVADPDASVVWEPGSPTVSPVRALRAGGMASSAGEALARARDVLDGARTSEGDPLFARLELTEDEQGPLLEATFAAELGDGPAVVAGRTVARSEFTTPEGHSGDHAMNGLLLGYGPPFRAGATARGARAVDIAPTVLHLLGVPAARDMEGIVLESLLDREWRDEHAVRYVRTYGSRDEDAEAISTEADERIREELRALGYLQ